MNIPERIELLRQEMRREGLAAYIILSTDPHQSEYVPRRWQGREWFSGFNASAGTVVVTLTAAALWTDSRYFLAAAQQLEDSGIELMKMGLSGTPTIARWIGEQLRHGGGTEVGVDGMTINARTAESLVTDLRAEGGLTLRTSTDLLDRIWTDRPPIPLEPVEQQPLDYCGETCRDKLARIRKALRQKHADGMLVSALDDIAWTLNLRGNDVPCNPVFVAYLLIATTTATLYIDPRKLTEELHDYLASQGVRVAPYENVRKGLRNYFEYNILLSPDETSATLMNNARRAEAVRADSPIPAMKAVKNAAEIRGFRNAMLRDGVAMVRFLKWLKPAVEAGGQTEMSVTQKLARLRAEQALFRDISFDTIAGYGPHGAIVHYEATPDTDAPLEPRGLLLLDSGAQYQDGTTDITRTIALGPLTPEERRVYTLVLKGHIGLARCKFPDGATGTQLDALAREAMWREGMNYLHGTGHGVGSYLNVHEGPHQIRMEWKPTPLRAGMTVTNEPGLYLAGRFGVRIENTVIIEPYKETEFGRFLQFDPLTLCPIDTAPILTNMLHDEEVEWLNSYHARVRRELEPLLEPDEQAWLRDATAPLAIRG